MPYFLKYSRRAHFQLGEISLTRNGRNRLFAAIAMNLMEISDDHRNDPTNRPANAPGHFTYAHLLQDNGRMHAIKFTVDDTCASAGVLQVVSVIEHLADE